MLLTSLGIKSCLLQRFNNVFKLTIDVCLLGFHYTQVKPGNGLYNYCLQVVVCR